MKKLNSNILDVLLKGVTLTMLKTFQEFIEEHVDEFDKILLIGDVEKNKDEAIRTIRSNDELFLLICENNLKTHISLEGATQRTEEQNHEMNLLSCEIIKILYQKNKSITQEKITQAIDLLRRNKTFMYLFETDLTKDFNQHRSVSKSIPSFMETKERILVSHFFLNMIEYKIIQDEELDNFIKNLSEFMQK